MNAGSNNILLSNPGVSVESGTIRIGSGTQNAAFIAGIQGTSVSGTPQQVLIGANGQLGTASATPTALEATVTQHTGQISDLTGQVDDQATDLAALEPTVTQHSGQITQLTGQDATQDNRLTTNPV